jgi:hypothetical protein
MVVGETTVTLVGNVVSELIRRTSTERDHESGEWAATCRSG